MAVLVMVYQVETMVLCKYHHVSAYFAKYKFISFLPSFIPYFLLVPY